MRDLSYHLATAAVCVVIVVCMGLAAVMLDPVADPSGRVLLVVACVFCLGVVIAGRL